MTHTYMHTCCIHTKIEVHTCVYVKVCPYHLSRIMADHAYIHAYMHTYIYIALHACMHTQTLQYICVYTHGSAPMISAQIWQTMHTYMHTAQIWQTMHTYIHTYIHYIHTYMHTHIHYITCMHAYTNIRVHMCVYTQVCPYHLSRIMADHAYIHAYCTNMADNAYMHTYIHTYIHIYITLHTCIHKH
jgi:hypothetical protein